MGIELMGKVLVTARIENLKDQHAAELGLISADQIRGVEVIDALVDPGATQLSMPKRLIEQLGLNADAREKLARMAPGTRRDLIAPIPDLELRWAAVGRLEVEFSLPSGSYATEVIRQFTRSPFLIDEADRGSDS